MGKSRFVAATALLGLAASAFSVPAMADSFSGVCTLSGTATLTPGIGPIPNAAAMFSFDTAPSLANQCTGVLNGVQVVAVTVSAHAEGSGILQGLGCTASTGAGSGTLTINGTDVDFTLTIAGAGPQVTLAVLGTVGGAATGQASFATDTNAVTDCAGAGGATSLDFLIAATAANLTD